MGISFGLFGLPAGILGTPILYFIFGLKAIEATSYSLYLLGLITLISSFRIQKHRWAPALHLSWFWVPLCIGMIFARVKLLPQLSQDIWINQDLGISIAIIITFFETSYFQLVPNAIPMNPKPISRTKQVRLALGYGLIGGVIFGLSGINGGFWLIYALVRVFFIKTKNAQSGVYLLVFSSIFAGIFADFIIRRGAIDWIFLTQCSVILTGGLISGFFLSGFISPRKLGSIFGWFTLLLGLFMVAALIFF
jgi:uncharacterized membrane protein YfcA